MNVSDREILDHFIRTRQRTIALFKQVPIDWLERKVDGEDMTMGWLFMHIADAPNWWMHYCMQDGKGWKCPSNDSFDPSSINDALANSLKRVQEFFELEEGIHMNVEFELPPEKREGEGCWIGRNRILYLTDHEVHHRGKIILALRQWGMKDIPFMPF